MNIMKTLAIMLMSSVILLSGLTGVFACGDGKSYSDSPPPVGTEKPDQS